MPLRAAFPLALTLPLVLWIACDSDPPATDDTGTGTPRANLVMSVHEHGTDNPLPGATVTFEGATSTTDSEGTVTLELPTDTSSQIGLTLTGFPAYLLYATMLDVDQAHTFYLASDATLSALGEALSITRDPARGLLSVGALDGTPGSWSPLAGATIQIDAAHEAQFVFDSGAAAGFSAGDTTLAGSSSASVFVNVAPGTVTPAITPPAGYTCELGPPSVQVEAGSYTIVNYYCQP